VGSRESDKYHLPGCRWAKEIKPGNEVWFKDVENAKAHSLISCIGGTTPNEQGSDM